MKISLALPYVPQKLFPNVIAHYHVKAKMKKWLRQECKVIALTALDGKSWEGQHIPVLVTMKVFTSYFKCPDADGCLAAYKAGIDGIAEALGIDDKNFFYLLHPPVSEFISMKEHKTNSTSRVEIDLTVYDDREPNDPKLFGIGG
jgi:crossover junction endodeoxyribonuclease RusA